jgi:hypothetical protein
MKIHWHFINNVSKFDGNFLFSEDFLYKIKKRLFLCIICTHHSEVDLKFRHVE